MQGDNLPFLGRGWAFPVRFESEPAGVALVEGVRDIEESIRILLSTAQGERVMVPTYGCDLWQYVFAPLTTSMMAEIREMVGTAILRWEPRIDLLGVAVSRSPDQPDLLLIEVDFRIRRTNVRSNLVYPFYLSEATLARGP